MKRFPSLDSPRIATNTSPGFTWRESYSTPATSGLPLWASTSAPYKSSRRVTAVEYIANSTGQLFTSWTRRTSRFPAEDIRWAKLGARVSARISPLFWRRWERVRLQEGSAPGRGRCPPRRDQGRWIRQAQSQNEPICRRRRAPLFHLARPQGQRSRLVSAGFLPSGLPARSVRQRAIQPRVELARA